jgi:hypothetical protein
MRARLRDERGVAVAAAMMTVALLMALGLGVAAWADGQQRAARRERTAEASFQQAEAVLNAQVFQLGRTWPSTSTPATSPCKPTTPGAGTTATTCPDPASVAASFTGVDYTAAGCADPKWETIVQDDDPAYGGTQYYDPQGMNPNTHAAVPYDANGNNAVWVRATATPQCRRQTIVALATRGLKSIDWPHAVLTADWFQTSNKGNKVIINTQGPGGGQPADVSTRCVSRSGSSCKNYQPGQIAPPSVTATSTAATPILNSTSVASLRDQAQQNSPSTYFSGCPSSVSLSSYAQGTVVFVEGGPACVTSASGNTAAKPVIFVLNDGAFSLSGNATFYGLLYAVNASNQSSTLVTLSGCSHIQGMVAVDGRGGVDVGSCKQNLVYDPTILSSLRVYGGTVLAKNSFRVLPANTPIITP